MYITERIVNCKTKCLLRIRIDEHFKNFNLNEKFYHVASKHRKKYFLIKYFYKKKKVVVLTKSQTLNT